MPIPQLQSERGKSFLSGEQNTGFEVPVGVVDKIKKEAKKEYKYGEHIVNRETYDFLRSLEGQIGISEVLEVISRDNTKIENGDLIKLNCNATQIITLPELPASLQVLYCSHTSIISLPKLPTGLQELGCSFAPITSLPELPAGLRELHCLETKITSLPELPAGLQLLSCSNTKITSLPELPASLTKLDCYYTPLSENLEEVSKIEKYCKEHNIFLSI